MRRRFRAFAGLRWAVVGPICTRGFAPQDACAKGPHDGDRTLSKTCAYRVAQALAKATKRWKIGNAGRPSAVRDWATTPIKNEQGAGVYPLTIVGDIGLVRHGGAQMDRHSVFMTAFWAGLASPAAVYASTPVYRPQVCDLTFFAPFAVVGDLISLSLREADAGRTEAPERSISSGAEPEQLSLRLE